MSWACAVTLSMASANRPTAAMASFRIISGSPCELRCVSLVLSQRYETWPATSRSVEHSGRDGVNCGRGPALHRNAALADAAAQGAGLDGAPQHLVAGGEGAAVRHRQPQPQQQPVVALVVVFERGASVGKSRGC